MYFLMLDAYPKLGTEMADMCESRVNVWVNTSLEATARKRAIEELEGYGWNVGEIVDCKKVSLTDCQNNNEAKELYEQAMIDGEVFYLHSVDNIALKKDGTYRRKFLPSEHLSETIESLKGSGELWVLTKKGKLFIYNVDEQPIFPLFTTKQNAVEWREALFSGCTLERIDTEYMSNNVMKDLEELNAFAAIEDLSFDCLISISNFYLK